MIFVIRFMTGVLAAFSAFAGCFLIQHPLKHFSLGASLFAFGISAAFLFFAFRLHGAAKPGKKYFPIWAVLFPVVLLFLLIKTLAVLLIIGGRP